MLIINDARTVLPTVEWQIPQGKLELRVLICKEDDGGYSVHALHLPGCRSQGETIDDAVQNITEAFQGLAETYRESGESIPWQNKVEIDRTGEPIERWVLVDA